MDYWGEELDRRNIGVGLHRTMPQGSNLFLYYYIYICLISVKRYPGEYWIGLQKFYFWGVQLYGNNMGWVCSVTCCRQGTRPPDKLSASRIILVSLKLYSRILTRGGINCMVIFWVFCVLHTMPYGNITNSPYQTFRCLINVK